MTRLWRPALRQVAALALLGGVVGVLACTGGDESGASDAGGAGTWGGIEAGHGGAAGDGAAPWDPVWHKTTPASWPTVPPESPAPDCGPGCRMALNVSVVYISRQTTATKERVLATSAKGLAFAAWGSSQTYLVPDGKSGEVGYPSMWGDHVAALRSFGAGDGEVDIISLTTGERKSAFRFTPGGGAVVNADEVALGPRYLYFHYRGLERMDLQTGERKLVKPGGCSSMCATATGLLCESGRIYFIQPGGHVGYLDNGGAMQVDGKCSPDRKRYAWIDFRDPPGPSSTFALNRNGGEVYMRDLGTGVTHRLTFDSPSDPMGKGDPAVGKDIAVWSEPDDGAPRNPPELSTLNNSLNTLAKLDLKTGERCRLHRRMPLGHKLVYGHHVYGIWPDKQTFKYRLIDLDLDNPGLQWTCQPTPGWPAGGVK